MAEQNNGNGTGQYQSADDILALDDIETEEVVIPEWNNARFWIKVLSMEELLQARKSAMVFRPGPGGKPTEQIDELRASRAMFRLACVEPSFTEEQVEKLFKKRAGLVQRIVGAINKLNNLDAGESEEAAREIADQFRPEDGD